MRCAQRRSAPGNVQDDHHHGEAPVVDVQNSTRVQRVLSDEVLAALPARVVTGTC